MNQVKQKQRNFTITYTGNMEEMAQYIMDKTGVTNRSQVFAMALLQYYRTLRKEVEGKQ